MARGLAYLEANKNFYESISKQGNYDRYYTPAFVIGLYELVDPVKYKPRIQTMVNKPGPYAEQRWRLELL